MHDWLEELNQIFAALPARLRQRHLTVWGAAAVLTILMSAGLGRLQIDTTMESFFFDDDPVRRLHERFKDTFGSDEGVYIVYEARDGDIFSPTSLTAVRGLQEELLAANENDDAQGPSPLHHIVDVTTIVNASYLEVREDTLVSRDFVEQIPETADRRRELRSRALAHKDYPGFYLSNDSRYGGIWIRTDLGTVPFEAEEDEATSALLESDLAAQFDDAEPPTRVPKRPVTMAEYAEFVAALAEVTGKQTYTRSLILHSVGNPVVMGFFNDVLVTEIEGLFVGALLIMMIVLGV
ncbi:MAG: hypothetical protein CMJ84_03820, partial [Planctomycetes bacterium]|nr:hypothetical protein [Planctomycetota bacterium]